MRALPIKGGPNKQKIRKKSRQSSRNTNPYYNTLWLAGTKTRAACLGDTSYYRLLLRHDRCLVAFGLGSLHGLHCRHRRRGRRGLVPLLQADEGVGGLQERQRVPGELLRARDQTGRPRDSRERGARPQDPLQGNGP